MTTRVLAAAVAVLASSCAPDEPAASGAPCAGLLAGDLVITEVFADYGAPGSDDGHEWIELYAAAGHAVDLAGVALVHSRADGSREKRFVFAGGSLEPGAYHVVGNAVDPMPAYVDESYADRLGDLVNTGGGRLAVMCGTTMVDEASYGGGGAGRSLELDGGAAPDYTVNDDPARWCSTASDEVEPGVAGTPGAANGRCATAMAGLCDDGGVARAVVRPQPGALVITEVMANPAGADGEAEWIEIRADDRFDLNELIVGKDGADADHRSAIASARCLTVEAGSYALLAASADRDRNGGLPAPAAVVDLALGNSDGAVFVGAADGTVLDAVTWTATRDGVSIEGVDGVGAEGPAGNDNAANRCEPVLEYGAGGRGTPGAVNDCGKCLDGDALRPIRAPGLLDVEIAEWMANPEGLAGDRGEYIELRAAVPIDLNGIQIGRSEAALEAPLARVRCVALAPGDSAVLVHTGSDITDADGTFGFALVQSSGSIVIAQGGAVIDHVTYAASTAGRSTAVDERGATCTTPAEDQYLYNGTDHGTPRQPNPPCR
jgi:hypothetical protein